MLDVYSAVKRSLSSGSQARRHHAVTNYNIRLTGGTKMLCTSQPGGFCGGHKEPEADWEESAVHPASISESHTDGFTPKSNSYFSSYL